MKNNKLKASVFIATSLDGFIARNDGKIDWLDKANATIPKGEDFGFNSFFNSVDALVMGRKTFETALAFDPWPYGSKKVVVLSSQLKTVPAQLSSTVTIVPPKPDKIVEKLSSEGAKHIYVDGGRTIQGFLAHNLIDEMTITTIPVLIGAGIPLFGKVKSDIELKHLKTQAYLNGFVQSHYSVKI